MIPKISIVTALTLLLAACATSPTGTHQLQLFSHSELAKMGAQSYAKIKEETPTSTNKALTAYVDCVAHALTKQVGGDWVVTLFQSKQVNAFALPGGKIGVYTGLLKVADGQAQLAAVLGHEIGHVEAKHSNARLSAQYATSAGIQVLGMLLGENGGGFASQQIMGLLGVGAQVGILLPYTRGQESEADLIGLDLMAKAGFDPRQAVELWRNMRKAAEGKEPPELLSTHPSSSSRIKNLQDHLPKAMQLYKQSKAHPNCHA